MELSRRAFGTGLLGALAGAAGHVAAQSGDVDMLLVLLNDGSGSIDADEYRLQREGTAAALERPEILQAIARLPTRSIAVAYGEWGSPGDPQIILPWMRISTPEDAEKFSDLLVAAPRRFQSYNAIGDGLVVATDLIRDAPFRAARAKIDIAGDGPDMRSLVPASVARDRAIAAGITINALAIQAEGSGPAMRLSSLRAHYEENVIGGPGAFVATARDRVDFAYAIFNKMIRELT
ncbi:MAG: DUF1194 domain-containing protein [Rhodospirillales bacterium]|nr:DUF1194 domain-containing protein [Rhodospirillales bacterium]